MVNFEEATLVKGAYVEIDGVEYPVHMPQYSGGTAVSPEIMNKLQEDLKKDMETRIVTGQEVATNEYIDDKRVYVKRFDCGALPNGDIQPIKEVPIDLDLSIVTIVRISGTTKNPSLDHLTYPLPFYWVGMGDDSVGVLVTRRAIQIKTAIDKSNFTETYVDLYYTKNNE